MDKWGFVIEARSDAALERYKELHRAVPAEIAGANGALAAIGVRQMTIMCAPPRTLFMLVEADPGFDPARDFGRALKMHPVVQAWDDQMHAGESLLKRIEGNDTDMHWFRLDQVFDWERERMLTDTGAATKGEVDA